MFSWEFSNKKEHSATWYITGVILILVLISYGIISELYVLSIAAFLFAGTYALIDNNATSTMRVTIDEFAIHVGTTVYELRQLERFAILGINGVPHILRLIPKKRLSNVVDIPLTADVNPVELRNWLLGVLEEDTNAKYSTSDAIIDRIQL